MRIAVLVVALGLLSRQEAGAAVTCAAADSMRDLIAAWAAGFARDHPGETVAIDGATSLSAEGFDRLLAGQADCVAFVREPFPAELAAYRARFGGEPLLITVAGGSYATRGGTHAIAIYVNAANPLARLTMAQLRDIFAGSVTRWSQLGVTGPLAGQPIHVYGMLRRRDSGNPPGIVNFLQRRLLAGAEFRADLREQTDRPGQSALAAIVARVAEDGAAIGFSGFAFAAPGARTVALAETAAGPYYAGSRDEVARRLYPLSRSVYLMMRPQADGRPSPSQRRFLAEVLSERGQGAVAADHTGFLPLTAAELAEQRARINPQ